MSGVFFFFQAEDGIRDLVRSRGLGDVYKRQGMGFVVDFGFAYLFIHSLHIPKVPSNMISAEIALSLIHI